MSSRWFHSVTTGKEAEDILLSTTCLDGSFLVRPSESTEGNFTISVRHRSKITHIKVINDGDCYCLQGSPDPFATLASLVQHYMDTPNSIKEKSGSFIELLYPIRSNDPTAERWYHGPISSKEAERVLLSKGKQGSYLVRESQSQPGQYALAVRCYNGVQQIIIRHKNGKFDVGSGQHFTSLRELVEYYVQNPKLHDIKDQSPIKLREPFQSTSFLATNVSERIKVLEKDANGKTGFREEFEQLQRFDHNDGVYSTKDGQDEHNKWKNRYKNILPYDHSRVRLKGGDPKDPGRDYINANYIDVELRSWKVRYIAAQGTLPSTIGNFWSMVYQHNSSIIVMLTNEVEAGKSKCAKYWPDLGLSSEHDKIVVDNMLEHKTKNFTMRELRVYHADKAKKAPHMVYQYHFTEWPDHGVPDDPGAVLGLLNEIHVKHEACGRSAPIVVHCSAGIGRTGSVMVIDVLMHLIDEQGIDAEVDVQKTAQLLRTQRSGMLQTERQYRFAYMSVLHYIEAEGQRQSLQKSKGSDENRPSYGNIDFTKADITNDSHIEKSPVPNKPVPRPVAQSLREKPTGKVPDRSNALRHRVHTEPHIPVNKRPVPSPLDES